MKVAHVLRKCDPDEWGGTESHLWHLVEGLKRHGVESVLFSPRLGRQAAASDPFESAGVPCRRFHAVLPVLGLDAACRARAVAVGGNLLSLDAPVLLWREPGLDLVHAHVLNRLGGVARTVARLRRIPYVVSVHGGVTTLPDDVARRLTEASREGLDWGRPYGFLFGSRRVLRDADAVITFNPTEAAGLAERHPGLRVVTIPHGIPVERYSRDHREAALAAFPDLRGRRVLLCVGRVDPVKNQGFLVERMPRLLGRHPDAVLVLAGPVTAPEYAAGLRERVAALGLTPRVLWTGEVPPGDPRLAGLYQVADVVLLPSRSEAYGLTLLEAWAAGTPVVASRTAGASGLVTPGENGFLHDVDDPEGFHGAVERVLADPDLRARLGEAGRARVCREHDLAAGAARVHALYEEVLRERRR